MAIQYEPHYEALYQEEHKRRVAAEQELQFVYDLFARQDIDGNRAKIIITTRKYAIEQGKQKGYNPFETPTPLYLPKAAKPAGVSEKGSLENLSPARNPLSHAGRKGDAVA